MYKLNISDWMTVFTLGAADPSSETSYPLDNSRQTDNTSFFENGRVLTLAVKSAWLYPSQFFHRISRILNWIVRRRRKVVKAANRKIKDPIAVSYFFFARAPPLFAALPLALRALRHFTVSQTKKIIRRDRSQPCQILTHLTMNMHEPFRSVHRPSCRHRESNAV